MSYWRQVTTIDELEQWLLERHVCLLEQGADVVDGKTVCTVTLAPAATDHAIHRALGLGRLALQRNPNMTDDLIYGQGPTLREALYQAMHEVELLIAKGTGAPPPTITGAA